MDYRQRLFQHYVTTHFAALREISIAACERHRATFRAYFRHLLPEDKGAKILDVGCGYGPFLYFLQKEGYWNACGVDISPEQVEAARHLGIDHVYCEDLLTFLHAHFNTFGCITAFDVIEHFPKEEVLELLDAIHQALQSGGTFIMQVPNGASPFHGTIQYADFTHEVAFTRESVVQVLSAAGFINLHVYPTGPVVHGVLSAVRWVIWQTIRLLLVLYLAAETGSMREHILTANLIATAQKP
jgi:cyclopropane fatty-acyl-phospholipid synthase-like methyltransferase